MSLWSLHAYKVSHLSQSHIQVLQYFVNMENLFTLQEFREVLSNCSTALTAVLCGICTVIFPVHCVHEAAGNTI